MTEELKPTAVAAAVSGAFPPPVNPNLPAEIPPMRDEAACAALLRSVVDLVAECDMQPSFCGFQVIEQRNTATGELLAIRLIAHDKIGDIVSPRVG